MKTVKVSLNSIDKVKSFVNVVNNFDTDFDLVSGSHLINPKSIMGIFSLNITHPIDLNIHHTDHIDTILEALQPYLAKAN